MSRPSSMGTRLTIDEITALAVASEVPLPAWLLAGVPTGYTEDRAATGRRALAARGLVRIGASGPEVDETLGRCIALTRRPGMLSAVATADGVANRVAWLASDPMDTAVFTRLGSSGDHGVALAPTSQYRRTLSRLTGLTADLPAAEAAVRVSLTVLPDRPWPAGDRHAAPSASSAGAFFERLQQPLAGQFGDAPIRCFLFAVAAPKVDPASDGFVAWATASTRGAYLIALRPHEVCFEPASGAEIESELRQLVRTAGSRKSVTEGRQE